MNRKFSKNTVLVNAMEGIGDQIYIRPFLRELAKNKEVYVNTFTPFLYADLNVQFVDPRRKQPVTRTYRTQQKAFETIVDKSIYVKEPPYIGKIIETHYKGDEVKTNSIVSTFYRKFELPFDTKIDWCLPEMQVDKINELRDKIFELSKIDITKDKIAIVRPATVRKEWEVHTRNADPHYISWCAKTLIEYGYKVISIADCKNDEEWIVQPAPVAHLHLLSGELGLPGTLELIKHASIVVGGSGFIIPATISAKVPLFVIFGGRMAYDTPYKVFHNSMDMTKIGWAVPDNPCRCVEVKHNCDKTITHLDTLFMEFVRRIENDKRCI